MKAAIYTRVSSDEQAEAFGLDVQRERCKAQITAKGWQYVGEYCDEGLSGTLNANKRPALRSLLDDVCAGKIDAVIVLALDRLARKTRLVLEIVDTLDSCGATIVSTKESLDTSTPQGRFVLTMFAAIAELERDTIVERTRAGLDARAKIDGERGGRLPDGYMRSGDAIEIVPERASIVRQIFDMRDQGLTLRAIADKLNSGGIRTARGHTWHASSVREVLQNENAYRGGKRGESEVTWVAILD